jgi:hypothetical protein
MLPKVLAVLLLIGVGLYFLLSAEDGAAVSLLDWMRDPARSRSEHARQVERDRERTALAPVDGSGGRIVLDDPARPPPASQGVLETRGDEAAQALAGAEGEDDLEALLASGSVRLHGVAVAADGSAWEGVELVARQPGGREERARSDARGAFELALRGANGTLALDEERWVLLGGELGLAPGLNVGGAPRVLVLAPRADLSGRTLDAQGAPLADVLVRVEHDFAGAPTALRELLPPRLELRARSDAQGRWTLAPLPDLPGARVRFEAEGRAALERDARELRASGDVTLPED